MEVNALLIIIVLIIIGCVLLGCKKGFVHTVFTMLSLVIIIFLTGLLSPYVGEYITNHTQVPDRIRSKVEQKISFKVSQEVSRDRYIDKIEIPDQLKDVIKDKSEKAGDAVSATTTDGSRKMIGSIYDRITEFIVNAIAYLFTLAVVVVVVIVAGLLLDIVAKLPGIKQANTILGGIFGLAQGYLIVSLLYIAAMAFAATGFGSAVIGMVNNNQILTWFYEHNFVVEIVFGMLK